MKKILILIFMLSASVSSFSQKKNLADSVFLYNEADSISYAAGVSIADLLPQKLIKLGVLQDTSKIRGLYSIAIDSESDAKKKKALEKKMNQEIDSISILNNVNLNVYLQAIQIILNAKQLTPYAQGLNSGFEIVNSIVPNLTKNYIDPSQEVNLTQLMNGFVSVAKNKPLAIDNSKEYLSYINTKNSDKIKLQNDKNNKLLKFKIKEEGAKFLTENKTKKDVIELPDGLQYKIIKKGKGKMPLATDNIKIQYIGRYLDGETYASSPEMNSNVSELIAGLKEVVLLMPVGSNYIVYVPSNLTIGANSEKKKLYSVLIFNIKLLSIEAQPKDTGKSKK